MKIEAIHIEDQALLRDIETLAARKGVPAEQAVADAVRDKLEETRPAQTLSRDERRRLLRETLARIDRLPHTGPMLTDEDLYDEDGMPR